MIKDRFLSLFKTNLSELPVLIIFYARTTNVITLIEQLQRLGILKIYIAFDGPRTLIVKERQEELLRFLDNQPDALQKSISIWRRVENLGVGVSVITALDWFFSKVQYGAVLEDDLIVEDTFFPYLHHFLEVFEGNKDVALISGNRAQSLGNNSHSLSLVNYPQTWGWGTWRDRWHLMRLVAFSSSNLQKRINLNSVENFWHYGTKRVLKGLVDTWDIPIANYMLQHDKVAVLPPVNLVSNIGNDSYATHTFVNMGHLSQPTKELLQIPNADFPSMLTTIGRNNSLLEKYVFKVRRIHALLPIYSIFDSLRQIMLSLDNLERRLENVVFPHENIPSP
jgi:hypothetical protein